ncbi:50S ribosomal protein L29 [Candidatus Woesearchaeota archaeon]|nr:50S ribosomal protein L29 [Candidatus Woesearchaeota archaeon]
MSLIKKNELKNINVSAIDEKISEFNKELMKLNTQRAVGTAIENPGRIRLLRRTIAKLLTVQNTKSKISEKNTKEAKTK